MRPSSARYAKPTSCNQRERHSARPRSAAPASRRPAKRPAERRKVRPKSAAVRRPPLRPKSARSVKREIVRPKIRPKSASPAARPANALTVLHRERLRRPASAVQARFETVRMHNEHLRGSQRERSRRHLKTEEALLNTDRCSSRQQEIDYWDKPRNANATEEPGPAHYSPRSALGHTRCASFGAKAARGIKPETDSPGPAAYDVDAGGSINPKTGRSFGGTIMLNEFANERSPGSKYNLDSCSDFHQKTGSTMKGFSFGAAKQRPPEMKDDSVYYDMPEFPAGRSASFGAFADREIFVPTAGQHAPFGPVIDWMGRNSRSCTFGAPSPEETLSEKKSRMFPSPGPSDYGDVGSSLRGPSASFGAKASRQIKGDTCGPGPAGYHLDSKLYAGPSGCSFTGGSPRHGRFQRTNYHNQ